MTYNVFSGTLNPAQSINQPCLWCHRATPDDPLEYFERLSTEILLVVQTTAVAVVLAI